ncbi:hypothetical protein PC121_g17738 [Phytophthora cactorum]|nr:hypothetical protein PC120_g17224 [Phytophthora cactorum]KAG3051666.1 hypothetical protein PC121_g17738 [Phytophthora cactorum]KAG4047105.1 hypothetical protein PC123_g17530 [Phytophthora cactorum]
MASFEHCSSVAREIICCRRTSPATDAKLMAGDVATAYPNACTHSECVYMFAGHITEDNATVTDLTAAFGWTGSPGTYGMLGGAVVFQHRSSANASQPSEFYNYNWVDDHVNVASDEGSKCAEFDRSLRWAMTIIMGPAAMNEDNLTPWRTRLKVLGLVFDTTAGTVTMPLSKIAKTKGLVARAFHASGISRSKYRALLGSLGHVATCVRPARVFIQRLREGEHRLQSVRLLWWWYILNSPTLNGVPLEYFVSIPPHDITVITDASDERICAIDPSLQRWITNKFPL